MSRSYKKTPICTDGRSGKFGKMVANRKVRYHKGDIANGKAYRKLYESWDIHDYVSYYSEIENRRNREAEEKAILNSGVPHYRRHYLITLSEQKWEKIYRRK